MANMGYTKKQVDCFKVSVINSVKRHGNVSRAARDSGIHRGSVAYWKTIDDKFAKDLAGALKRFNA